MQQAYTSGELSLPALTQRLQSWEAHLLHGDTYHLRRDIFNRTVFHPPPEPLPFKNSAIDDLFGDL
jgi:RNA-directed DNA polymerase